MLRLKSTPQRSVSWSTIQKPRPEFWPASGGCYDGVKAPGAFVRDLDSQTRGQHLDVQVDRLRCRQAGVRDAVGHDLRDDKGAPLDDLFFELSTKPVERPSCGGGRVPVWREYRRTRSVAIDQPADAPDESGGEPWDRNASGLGLRRMNAAMPGACPAPDVALTELVTLRSGALHRRLSLSKSFAVWAVTSDLCGWFSGWRRADPRRLCRPV